jgi:hypothetical protein
MPNRLTSSRLGLTPTAYIIKCVAEDVLAQKEGDGVLEVELVCTPHAKRHLEAGLKMQRRKPACTPCDPCEVGKPAQRATAKKDARGK